MRRIVRHWNGPDNWPPVPDPDDLMTRGGDDSDEVGWPCGVQIGSARHLATRLSPSPSRRCVDTSLRRLPIWSADQSGHYTWRTGRPHSLRWTVPSCGSSWTGQLGPRHLARNHKGPKPLCQALSASGRGAEWGAESDVGSTGSVPG